MEELYDIYDLKEGIDCFIEQYWGTAIGEHIYRWRANTFDDDYDGLLEIYNELKENGYI